jgi:hypothetical protein
MPNSRKIDQASRFVNEMRRFSEKSAVGRFLSQCGFWGYAPIDAPRRACF